MSEIKQEELLEILRKIHNTAFVVRTLIEDGKIVPAYRKSEGLLQQINHLINSIQPEQSSNP